MRRLLDDPAQVPELRKDLQRSRAAGEDYPTADKLAQLTAALSDPTRQPLGQDTLFADPPAQWSWRTLHLSWKVVALVAIAGSAAVLVQPGTRRSARTSSHEPAPGLQQTGSGASEQSAAGEPPSQAQPSENKNELANHALAPKRAISSSEDATSSRREIAQLVRIRALLKQDPTAAYQMAQQSEREFPGGLLSEERQALAIVALRKTGAREPAVKKAREFFARFPDSPMRGLIEAEVGRQSR